MLCVCACVCIPVSIFIPLLYIAIVSCYIINTTILRPETKGSPFDRKIFVRVLYYALEERMLYLCSCYSFYFQYKKYTDSNTHEYYTYKILVFIITVCGVYVSTLRNVCDMILVL